MIKANKYVDRNPELIGRFKVMTLCTQLELHSSENNRTPSERYLKILLTSKLVIMATAAMITLSGCGSDGEPSRDVKASSEDALPSLKALDTSWTNTMVWIPGGSYLRGSESGQGDEKPVREIKISGFWVDATEVTNDQFNEFVLETGYVTVAERRPDSSQFPGVDPSLLKAGGIVFIPPGEPVSLRNHYAWWTYVAGANWRHPTGPDSDIQGKGNYPVVQMAWEDAVAYAQWAGKRLPSEAEWEYVAKAGSKSTWPWGDDVSQICKFGNVFDQSGGKEKKSAMNDNAAAKPVECDDQFQYGAPVGSFLPNSFGVYDTIGNVWEWTEDCSVKYYDTNITDETAFQVSGQCKKRSVRSGSWRTRISRHRTSFRGRDPEDIAYHHFGLRVARDLN